MSNCAHFPNFVRCVLVAGMLVLTTISTQSVQAQPGSQKQSDVEQLQKQLASLQSKIESMNQDESSNDVRVRSVGNQQSRRAVQPQFEDEMLIRLYDLSDIFAVSPSYPAVMPNDLAGATTFRRGGPTVGGGFGGGGGGFSAGGGGVFRVPPAPTSMRPPIKKQGGAGSPGNIHSATISLQELVAAIQNTVSPEQWEDEGGKASIQFLSNTLLITATKDMHAQINDLINLFREHFGKRRTVSIQTYLIRAGSAEAAELLDAKSNEMGAGVVNPDKWKAFLANAKSQKRFAYSATMTGHNNQTLHTLSGKQRQLTLDATPFETTKASMWFEHPDDVEPFGENGDQDDGDMNLFNRTRTVVGFKPVRQTFHDGAAIQITPLATRGGNFVILDLQAKVNELLTADEEAKKPTIFVRYGENEKAEVELDHADYVSYRLSTTVRCPKDQVVLAGGMTYDPNAEQEVPNLYLFVKTSIHTIEEDKSDWSKAGSEKPPAKKESSSKKPTSTKK